MSRRSKAVVLCAVSFAVVTSVTSAVVLIPRASTNSLSHVAPLRPVNKGRRNLSLQPEAFRVAQLLGKRFSPSSRSVTVSSGQLTIGESQRPLIITRRQTESGETVELQLPNGRSAWTAEEGWKPAGAFTDTEQMIMERLIFDSPDNFVLAQLRGASYSTVARNVRPPDAPDDYSGPLWTIVRVDEPQSVDALQAQSPWRLYYINSSTGLIDRIVSRIGEENIEAQIVAWSEQARERAPTQITWSKDGRTVMSYQANSVSHSK